MKRSVWNGVVAAALIVATIAFATAYRGAQASPAPVAHANVGAAQADSVTITDISSSCASSQLCGTLTVANPVAGATVTLKVMANPTNNNPNACGGGPFCADTGSSTVITLQAGVTAYNFCIPVAAEFNDTNLYNTLRVEVGATSGANFEGTTTKGPSVHCEDQTPTSGATDTPVPPTEVPPTEVPPTEVPPTATEIPTETGGVTEVPPTATEVPTETSEVTEVPGATNTPTEEAVATETATAVAGAEETPVATVAVLPSTGSSSSGGGSGPDSLALIVGLFALAAAAFALRARRAA